MHACSLLLPRAQVLHRITAAGGFNYTDVYNVPLALRGVDWSHVLASPEGLSDALRRHAAPQLLRALTQLLGSVALLGVLADGAAALRRGVRECVVAPAAAATPAAGAAALAHGAASLGASAALLALDGTARAAGLAASGFALLTLDARYAARRRARPVNAQDAALRGLRELPLGVWEAVAGLVTIPASALWASAAPDGGGRVATTALWRPGAVAALARGGARAAAHALFRPPAALCDALAKEASAGALALRRRSATAGGAGIGERARARLPRDFRAEAVRAEGASATSASASASATSASTCGAADDASAAPRAEWESLLLPLGRRGASLLSEGVVDGCRVKLGKALVFTTASVAYVDYGRGALRWRVRLDDVASTRSDAPARSVSLRTRLALPLGAGALPLRRRVRCASDAAFELVTFLLNRYAGRGAARRRGSCGAASSVGAGAQQLALPAPPDAWDEAAASR
jgi:hypothetical protein